MAENVDAMVETIAQNAVRPAVNRNGLDQRHSLRVPHRDRLAGSKPVMGLAVRGGAARAGIGDFTCRFQRIEVEYVDTRSRSGARHVQPAAIDIRVNVIKSAFAADLRGLLNAVGAFGEG